jgi:23S rRNA pseudouridine1911/1915/1917 synthase
MPRPDSIDDDLLDDDESPGPPALDEIIADADGQPVEDGDSEPVTRRYRVGRRGAGRIDKYVHNRFRFISRTTVQRYIREGQVTVNGRPTKPSYEPAAGDIVQITLPPPPPKDLIPQNLPLSILYEDDAILVINKQAGIVCHPAYAGQSGTIANAAAFHALTLSQGSDPFRPGIVHRLDKNTTGVMMIAKTDEAHWRLGLQFERRTIKKEYFAVCEGTIALDGDIINKPLAPHDKTTQRMVLPGARPPRQAMFKEAITEYRVEHRYRGYTTVRLFPRTGRTHQLRVHMASLGQPIAGDTLYGGHVVRERDLTGQGSTDPILEAQALHARRLRFVHPLSEKPLEIEAPLPATILRVLELLAARIP